MATKKEPGLDENIGKEIDNKLTFNPLLNALHENDKKNLFQTNVTTAFIKTGFPLFDYYFGSVVNIHDEMGRIIRQEPRIGQACGTFNVICGNTGSGKSQPVSTLIPTPEGWKRLGDIKQGDPVYSYDYTWQFGYRKIFLSQVLYTFPQGELDVYEITLSNGRTARCSLDHLWSVVPDTLDGLNEVGLVEMNLRQIMILLERHRAVYIPCCRKTFDHDEDSFTKSIDDTCDILSEIDYVPITDVKLVGKEECVCIYIDARSHLYLTDQFVVTHNTTLAAQIAANIIRQYKYANVIHFDCENRFDLSRAENITQLPASYFQEGNERYMIRSGMIGLDTIQEMIVKTYVNKKKLKDQLVVPSGYKDEFGKDVMIYEPTVVIIDSITTVLNETFNPDNAKEASDAEKMRGNTEGARDAKTLKGFFKDILPLCKEANIIVYGINHINTNMSISAFVPVTRQQNYLKQDESLPGGKTMLYYPFNIVKLTAKPSDSFTEDGDGVSGFIVNIEPIKSSSNQSGNNAKGISFDMVFSHKHGFDSLRTMIIYGRDHGLIEGNRNRLKFKDDDSFTFTFKNIYQEKNEKPIWADINKYIVPTLNEHLPFIEPNESAFDNESLNY